MVSWHNRQVCSFILYLPMKSDITNYLLIDGWNVCWKIPEIAGLIPERLSEARQRFNLLIKNYFYEKKINYQIIYDGQPDVFSAGTPEKESNIRFARGPEKADHLIISIVRKQKKPRQWTVITSDRELAHKIRAMEAQIISSEEFISRMDKRKRQTSHQTGKTDEPLSESEMEYWLEKFKKR